jgi:hypothetical protein
VADDERLELDDDGRVVGSSHVVDLADPAATEAIAATTAHAFADRHVVPRLRRHQRVVAASSALAVALALGAAWWTHRPAYVPPPEPIAIENAELDGSDIGGPSIRDDGLLLVAFAVRAVDPGVSYDVLGFDGPGLATAGVTANGPASDGSPARVEARAVVQCADGAVLRASSSDYHLAVRRTDASGSTELSVPLGRDVTSLDIALREYCLRTYAAPAVSVVDATVVGQAGTSVASLSLVVRNVSNMPVVVSTERRATGRVDVDLSSDVTLAPQRSAIVSSRLLVQDCNDLPRPAPVGDLPNPQIGLVQGDAAARAGITLRVRLGASSMLASYPLPDSVATLAQRLRSSACAAPPEVAARLVSAEGSPSAQGGWVVSGTWAMRTSGVGITIGREHFTGPPWGAGSSLVTEGDVDRAWDAAPSRLDGGAGSLVVSFTGPSCSTASDTAPETLPVRVMTADRVVYPFLLPIETTSLRQALASACPPA